MRSYLYLNYVCNCNCIFCASDETNTQMEKTEMSFDEVKDFLDSNNDKKEVFINGGEPTIHKDFAKIIKYAKERYGIVSLATNGLTFSDMSFLEKSLNLGLDRIVVPMYSTDGGEHDYIVQRKGAFEKLIQALHNIDYLIERSGLHVNIKMLVSGLTYRNNPEIPQFMKNHFPHIKHMSLYGLHYGSKALENKEECFVKFSEAKPFISQTIKNMIELEYCFHLDHIPLCSFDSVLLETVFEQNAVKTSRDQLLKRPDTKIFTLLDPNHAGDVCISCDLEALCPKVYGKNANEFKGQYGLKPVRVNLK